jgi:hypothetical protein
MSRQTLQQARRKSPQLPVKITSVQGLATFFEYFVTKISQNLLLATMENKLNIS